MVATQRVVTSPLCSNGPPPTGYLQALEPCSCQQAPPQQPLRQHQGCPPQPQLQVSLQPHLAPHPLQGPVQPRPQALQLQAALLQLVPAPLEARLPLAPVRALQSQAACHHQSSPALQPPPLCQVCFPLSLQHAFSRLSAWHAPLSPVVLSNQPPSSSPGIEQDTSKSLPSALRCRTCVWTGCGFLALAAANSRP